MVAPNRAWPRCLALADLLLLQHWFNFDLVCLVYDGSWYAKGRPGAALPLGVVLSEPHEHRLDML